MIRPRPTGASMTAAASCRAFCPHAQPLIRGSSESNQAIRLTALAGALRPRGPRVVGESESDPGLIRKAGLFTNMVVARALIPKARECEVSTRAARREPGI